MSAQTSAGAAGSTYIVPVVALVTVVTMQLFRLVYNGPECALPVKWVTQLQAWGLSWQGTGSKGVQVASGSSL